MATIYQRGKSWYIQWRQNGEPRKKSLGKISQSEAETILHAKEVELRTGENILVQSQFQLFKNLALNYLNWHKHEYPDSHQRIYQITQSHLIPYFGMKSALLNPQEVEIYKSSRRGEVAIETVNKELRTLKAILNKSVEWGYITRNSIKSVKPIKNKDSKPSRWYTKHELDVIYNIDQTYAATWRLIANTGLRRAEALNLKWTEVLPDKLRILSTSRDRTKSGKWRDVPLSPGAVEALSVLENDLEFVLPRVTPHSLSRAFDRTLKKAGLDGSLHCLRHTFCSHLVMNGVPLRTVQILAGHSSFKTTEGYAHLSPDHLQSSVVNLKL